MIIANDTLQKGEVVRFFSLYIELLLHLLGQLVEAKVKAVALCADSTSDNLYLLQRQVGSLRIARRIVLCQIVVLIQTNLYLLVFLLLDNHRASCHVAQSLVVAVQNHGNKSYEAGGRTIDEPEHPSHQVGAQRRHRAVHLHHSDI